MGDQFRVLTTPAFERDFRKASKGNAALTDTLEELLGMFGGWALHEVNTNDAARVTAANVVTRRKYDFKTFIVTWETAPAPAGPSLPVYTQMGLPAPRPGAGCAALKVKGPEPPNEGVRSAGVSPAVAGASRSCADLRSAPWRAVARLPPWCSGPRSAREGGTSAAAVQGGLRRQMHNLQSRGEPALSVAKGCRDTAGGTPALHLTAHLLL